MKTTIGKLMEIINSKTTEYFGELAKVRNVDISKSGGLSLSINITGTVVFYVYYADNHISMYAYFTGSYSLSELFTVTPIDWAVSRSLKEDTGDAIRDLKDRFVQAVLDELLNIECVEK